MSDVLDQYFEKQKELEKQRQSIIQQLLKERAEIDERLRKLGYQPSANGVRRGRPAKQAQKEEAR